MRNTGRGWLSGTAVIVALCASSPGQGATLRVDAADPDADNSSECGSVETPCWAIQAAVNNAVSGDTILVAESTYTYNADLDPTGCAPSTAIVCVLNKTLSVFGGYANGNWGSRDPAANITVIDGENTTRGVLVKRGSLGADPAGLRIEGFVVERGLADRSTPDGDDAFGGGFSAVLVDDITIRQMTFRDNSAIGATTAGAGGAGRGGGISIRGGETFTTIVILDDLTIEDNVAMGGQGNTRGGRAVGGGLFLKDIDQLSSASIVVQRNLAQGGPSNGNGVDGGLRADALGGGLGMLFVGSAFFADLMVLDNMTAGGDPTGLGGTGGNAFGGGFFGESSALEIADGLLKGNIVSGGSALNGSPAQPASGSIGAGGGIMTFRTQVTLDRVRIVDNTAIGGDGPTNPSDGDRGTVGGGGGYFEETSVDGDESASITNSVFVDNFVQLGTGDGASGGGGGVFLLGIEASFVHVVVANNSFNEALLGGLGLVVNTRRLGFPDELPSVAVFEFGTISDHLFSGESALRVNSLSTFDFGNEESLFANNSIDWDGLGITLGTGSILSAPGIGFVSPGSPDFDYHILTSSPAVDAATGSTTPLDFDGHARGAAPDLGADEACLAIDEDLVLTGKTITGEVIEEACNTITAGPYTVTATGIVTFRAPVSVMLEDGFIVENGGIFTAENVVP